MLKADNGAPAAWERRRLIKSHAAKAAMAPTPRIPPPTAPAITPTFELFKVGFENTSLGTGIADPALVVKVVGSVKQEAYIMISRTYKNSIDLQSAQKTNYARVNHVKKRKAILPPLQEPPTPEVLGSNQEHTATQSWG